LTKINNQRFEKEKPMSKHGRTQAIKLLMEQAEQTTDPEMKLKFLKEAMGAMRKPGTETRGRKPSIKPPSLLTQTGTSLDTLPDGERIAQSVVLKIEGQCRNRGGWNALTRADKDILLEAAKATLSPADRQILEEYAAGVTA
jgi:hypothetical protein